MSWTTALDLVTRRTLIAMSTCAAFVGGCGRLSFDALEAPLDASAAGSLDAALDAPLDALACAADTTEIPSGSVVCIEKAQRGTETWTNASAACIALGRRLCSDAEWFAACTQTVGLSAMVGDGYEWVAEQSGGIAQKRGSSACEDMATHEILVVPYGYRCCNDL